MTQLMARICVAVFFSASAFFMSIPLVPLYIAELDPRSPLAGPTIAISFVLSAVLSPLWGSLAERYGPKPMMVRAAALTTAAHALSAWATSVDGLFISRLVAGVAFGFVAVATAALVRLSDAERRATDMGWLSSAKSAGALFGPAAGGLLVWWTGSFRAAFLAAAVASALTLLIAMSLPSIPRTRGASGPDLGEGRKLPVRRLVGLALTLTLALHFAGTVVYLWLPFLMSREHGATRAAGIVGVVTACAAGAGMLLAPVWGRFADRRQRGTALAATVLLPIPVLASLGLSEGIVLVAVLFVAAEALGSESVALLGAEVSRDLPQHRVGPYFGWSSTASQLGSAAAGAIAPGLVTIAMDLPVWVGVALYLVAGALVISVVRTIRHQERGVAA